LLDAIRQPAGGGSVPDDFRFGCSKLLKIQ